MQSEDQMRRLGAICTKIGSGATPRGGQKTYLASGPCALIRSQNIHNDGFSDEGLAYINEDQAEKLSNVSVHAGDVLLNITGDSVARVCQAPKSHLPARVNQHVSIVRPDPKEYRADFLRYYLMSRASQSLLLSLAASGGTRNALTKGMIENFVVPNVDIEEQRQVAAILSSLEDRISHNRVLAQNLESIARAIFKSWFVDFDPVRAKSAGQQPTGLDADIAALFPDRLVDSEIGEIPEGWSHCNLSELASLSKRSIKPRDFPESLWTHFSIPALDAAKYPAFELGGSIASGKYIVEPGSVLVSKLNPRFWRCWRPSDELIGSRSVCSTEFMQFIPERINRPYLWALATSEPFKNLVLRTTSGTTGSRQRAKPDDVLSSLVIDPGSDAVAAFGRVVGPLLRRIDLLQQEVQVLSHLRDTLLPRLISGKLRVADAEQAIANAV